MGCVAGCSSGDIADESDEQVLLNGQNIAGVWAVADDVDESGRYEFLVDKLVVVSVEKFQYYESISTMAFGYKDNYLHDCSWGNFVVTMSSQLYILADKVYVDNSYVCDLLLDGEKLIMVYSDHIVPLKKVKGFNEQTFANSGVLDENGLPIPLDFEIYYRTSDEKALPLYDTMVYLNDYSDEGNYGRILSLDSFRLIPDFSGCVSLTHINLPEGVTTLDYKAFADCKSLAEIVIPDNVTEIGDSVFMGCLGLKSVTIGENVDYMGSGVFYKCMSLLKVTIPNGVSMLGRWMFYDCVSLERVIMPESMTTIGLLAFEGCTSLKHVYCKALTPPMGYLGMFDSNAPDRKIFVPMESVPAYKNAEYWRDYADAIVAYDF